MSERGRFLALPFRAWRAHVHVAVGGGGQTVAAAVRPVISLHVMQSDLNLKECTKSSYSRGVNFPHETTFPSQFLLLVTACEFLLTDG